MVHPYAWLSWVTAAACAAFLTRNPLNLLLIGGSTYLVYSGLPGRRSPLAAGWHSLLKLGALFALFAVPMNALTVHAGRLVLFALPEGWPIIGGPITGEAVLFGLTTSLALMVILTVFATFNVAVDPRVLLRLTPPFLLEAGVVVAIAVSFIPQMVRSAQEIREAQLLRGHGGRGLRDLGPFFVSLLTTGLERSMQLAESMESRGFGGPVNPGNRRRDGWIQTGMLVCLVGLAAGLFLAQYRSDWAWAGRLWAAGAVAGLGAGLWLRGRSATRTRYDRMIWRSHDSLLVLISLAIIAGLAIVRLEHPELLVYYPYPPNTPWPPFNGWLGGLLLLLGAPAWLRSWLSTGQERPAPTPASRAAASLMGPSGLVAEPSKIENR